MSDSLRDQLLKAGFAAKSRSEPPARPPQRARSGKPKPDRARPARPARDPADIDLARAYALRDRNEREAREREKREAEQRARAKKERRQKLAALLQGNALNVADADIPRHFPHLNKIRRIYVTAAQLPRLNGGELAVVIAAGRYVLVTRETGLAARTIDSDALVLLCETQAMDDDGVPADLVW